MKGSASRARLDFVSFVVLLGVATISACGSADRPPPQSGGEDLLAEPPPNTQGAQANEGGAVVKVHDDDDDDDDDDDADAAAPGESPGPSVGACTTSEDCTLVADSCGRPHGVPVASKALPPPGPCEARKQARARPACEQGACVAAPIGEPDWYACSSAADCTTIQWPCALMPVAVARVHEAEAKRVALNNAARRSCTQSPNVSVVPTVACLFNACVTR